MKCLNCSETLVAIEFAALEIDYCLSCAGVWFDAGELEAILGTDQPVQLVETGLPSVRSKRRCPVCRRRLNTVSVEKGKRVELDSCPLGHGIWFDRGELHDVAELLGKPLRQSVVERLGEMFDSGSGRPR